MNVILYHVSLQFLFDYITVLDWMDMGNETHE